MPKKKKKRKNTTKRKTPLNKQPLASPSQSNPKDLVRRELVEKVSFLREKLGIRGGLLFKVVLFSPLLFGALAAKSSIQIELYTGKLSL